MSDCCRWTRDHSDEFVWSHANPCTCPAPPCQCPWCGRLQIRLDPVNAKGHVHCEFCRDKCRACNNPPIGSQEWDLDHDLP